VETIARIRRERFVKGKTIKEIARDLGISRNTIRKVLRSGETSFEYERTVQPRPKLARWTADLNELLEGNAAKPAREQLTLIRDAFQVEQRNRSRKQERSPFSKSLDNEGPIQGLARPESGRAFFADTDQFRAAETALSCVSGGKAAESQRLSRRRQETGIAQDCVVGLAGLEPATTRLWRKHANSTSPRRLSHSITTGGITLSFAFLGALARRLGLST
jgi:transcriptional regulator with XRE-family HTH domain